MRHARILFFAGLLAFAACGSDPATCEIDDNGDGTRTIACPGAEPIRVVDGDADASCTIGSGEDGGKVISCSDGTVVRLDADGKVIFPGSGDVAGTARLFGRIDHTGIRVSAVGTEFSTTTDATGAYRLTLPAGIHVLLFEAPGRVPARVTNIPVINGTWDLDPVVLKIARRIGGNDVVVTTSPSGDAVLAFTRLEAGIGWLELVELAQVDGVFEDDRRLGGVVTQGYAFSGDGRFVLYQERTGIDGALRLWDRIERQHITIAEHALRGHFASGDEAVVYEALDNLGGCELRAWWRENGREAVLGTCAGGGTWLFNEDGTRLLSGDADGSLVLRGVDDGKAHTLVGSGQVNFEAFLTGGRYLIYRTIDPAEGSVWRLLDGETGSDRLLGGNGSTFVAVSPDGGTILLTRPAGETEELVAHLVADETDIVVSSGTLTSRWRFSPDGARVLWTAIPQFGAPGVLHVVELAAPENAASYVARAVENAMFTGSRERVFLVDDAGAQVQWDPATGTAEELAPGGGADLLSDDGMRVAVRQLDGAVLVADFGDPVQRASTGPVGADTLHRWSPDGSGIVFGGVREDEHFVAHWAPPAEPVTMGTGDIWPVLVSPAGTFAFLECAGDCVGRLLVLFHPDSGEREPVDDGVGQLGMENGVLLYRVFDAEDEARSGFYAASLP